MVFDDPVDKGKTSIFNGKGIKGVFFRRGIIISWMAVR
jgi:hypothetical protein